MRKTLRVCFLVLALVLTVFGWNQSRAGVCLVWALLCVEELVSLQMQQNAKPVLDCRGKRHRRLSPAGGMGVAQKDHPTGGRLGVRL